MGYRPSSLVELERMRARGQKPGLPVVVGDSMDSAAWANRNGFFYVSAKDCGEDLTAFTGLFVLIRERTPQRLRDLAEQLALSSLMVTLFSLTTLRAEYLKA